MLHRIDSQADDQNHPKQKRICDLFLSYLCGFLLSIFKVNAVCNDDPHEDKERDEVDYEEDAEEATKWEAFYLTGLGLRTVIG